METQNYKRTIAGSVGAGVGAFSSVCSSAAYSTASCGIRRRDYHPAQRAAGSWPFRP